MPARHRPVKGPSSRRGQPRHWAAAEANNGIERYRPVAYVKGVVDVEGVDHHAENPGSSALPVTRIQGTGAKTESQKSASGTLRVSTAGCAAPSPRHSETRNDGDERPDLSRRKPATPRGLPRSWIRHCRGDGLGLLEKGGDASSPVIEPEARSVGAESQQGGIPVSERVPASGRTRQRIEALLANGVEDGGSDVGRSL